MKKKLITRKKNGFTLIELLATIAVLALIAVISMTFGSNIYSQSKDRAREAAEESVIKSGKLYFEENSENSTTLAAAGLTPKKSGSNNYYCFKVGKLIEKGYIKESELTEATSKYGSKINKNTNIEVTENNTTFVITNVAIVSSCH